MTVAELAEQADLDLDEAIVTLWDAGFQEVVEPSDVITPNRTNAAKRALGLATRRDFVSPTYWQHLLRLDEQEFSTLLRDLGIRIAPLGRSLPKGSVRKLRRAARERLGDIELTPQTEPDTNEIALPPLYWPTIGREQSVHHITAAEVAGIHACLEQDFAHTADPIEPPGVRDRNLLDSAAFRPMTSLGRTAKYPTVEMASAALLHSLALNHAFFNGNKRTALVAMLVMLDMNGMLLTCEETDLFRLVLQVAQHRLVARGADERADREVLKVAQWIEDHSRRSEHGEMILKWVRLRRILGKFGCWTDHAGGVGNRINVHREVDIKGSFGRQRRQLLNTQVRYAGEGTEVERNTVSKLRKDLWLDDEHGVDSYSFYSMEIRAAEDFIVTYRKTLSRLAKL